MVPQIPKHETRDADRVQYETKIAQHFVLGMLRRPAIDREIRAQQLDTIGGPIVECLTIECTADVVRDNYRRSCNKRRGDTSNTGMQTYLGRHNTGR